MERMKKSVERLGRWWEQMTDQSVGRMEESVENSKELMGGAVGGVGGTHAGVYGDVIRKFNDKKSNI